MLAQVEVTHGQEEKTDGTGATTGTNGATTGKKKPFSLIRTFVLADVITICNAVAGAGAILASMSYMATAQRSAIWTALVLLPIALACDALDGAVARWRRKS